MKKLLIAMTLAGAALSASPASAAVLIADGITYELDLTSISADGLTGNFILAISGVNTASDTEGGRTGINAFAFNDPTVGTAVSGSSTGFTFLPGGLNSGGCNGNGNFFCFDNNTPVIISASGMVTLAFSVTSDTIGSWADWAPSFKIDWIGSKNNYDLVSKDIPLNNCIHGDCPVPNPTGVVPEPATWAMMLLGFGAVGFSMRRKRAAALQQIA